MDIVVGYEPCTLGRIESMKYLVIWRSTCLIALERSSMGIVVELWKTVAGDSESGSNTHSR